MRILLVDDHTLVREGFRLLLQNMNPEVVTDEAANCEEALQRVAQQTFDLILLDLSMPGVNGVNALLAVRNALADKPPPCTPIVVLSGDDSAETVFATFNAGSSGFIPKSSNQQTLMQAIRHVLSGHIFMPRHVVDSSPVAADMQLAIDGESRPRIPGLSERDMEVVRALMRGIESNKELARELGVEVSTVKKHLERIYPTLGVHTRLGVCIAAGKLGLTWN